MGISVSTLSTLAIGGVAPVKEEEVEEEEEEVGVGSGAGLSLSVFLCLGDGATMLCAGWTGDPTISSLANSLASRPFPFSFIGVSVFLCFFLSSRDKLNLHTIKIIWRYNLSFQNKEMLITLL